MFPSSGFFSNVPCPYFVAGDCKRPNCHFKHQIPKPLNSHQRSGLASVASTSGYPSNHTHGAKANHPPSTGAPISYNPTPISQLKGRKASKDNHQEPERFPSPLDDTLGQGDNNSISDVSSDTGNTETQGKKLGASHHETDEGAKINDQVFQELFGDDSDASPTHRNADDENDDEVLILPTPVKPTGPLVDLTLDSDDADEDVGHNTANNNKSKEDSIDSEVLRYSNPLTSVHGDSRTDKHSERISDQSSKKHSDKHKKSSKDKSKHKKSFDIKKHKKSSHSDKSSRSTLPKKDDSKSSSKSHHTNKNPREKSSPENHHTHKNPPELPLAVASLSEEDQCKQLYEMFQRKEAPPQPPSSGGAVHEVQIPEVDSAGKKRVAREAPNGVAPKRTCLKKPSMISPQEMMNKRFEAAKAARSNSSTENKQSTSKIDYNATPGATSARTYKGLERKAHVPQSKKVKQSMDRPRIPPNNRSKVPSNTRQMQLNRIVDECLKLYPTEQDAYDRAKNEEESANSRASSKGIYTSLTTNIIKKLRDEQTAKQSHKQPLSTKVSHDTILAGKRAGDITVGLKKRHLSTYSREDMVGDLLFKKLRTYLMTPSQLEEHGFPRLDPGSPGHAQVVWGGYDKIPENKGKMRQCKRCGRHFWVDDIGEYVKKEDCVYHWGKAMTKRVHGAIEKIFTCCEERQGAEGCTISNAHVHETNKFEDLTGYMRTFAKSTKDYCGVYSLDCEMVYTTHGIEVARVTVIDDKLNVMFDSFIKPTHEVIDYNTRFSGLTEENFLGVDTTLKDVQAILLDMFQEDTILIGHSLNSDLIALKLIHETVVDTSVVFPHKLGLPYKRALKNLMLEMLNKLIQEAGAAGHDSSEDARACMELMKWKVYQDHMKDNR